VTNEYPGGIPVTGTSEAWGSILNIAVPSLTSVSHLRKSGA
jgi:hypothetical protein